jgi:diacylglycerol kinase (ATP)
MPADVTYVFLFILLAPLKRNHYTMQIQKTIRSFGPAFKGLKSAFLAENNFKVHLLAAVIVIALGFFLHVQRNDWLWLIAAIGGVFMMEFINTAIEKLTNLASPEYNEEAGKVKDISAGVVLIASFTSTIIGAIILIPYL